MDDQQISSSHELYEYLANKLRTSDPDNQDLAEILIDNFLKASIDEEQAAQSALGKVIEISESQNTGTDDA